MSWATLTADEAGRFMRGKEDQRIRSVIAGIAGSGSVTDFGCGAGIGVSSLYEKNQYVGLDASAELVLRARRENPGYAFLRWDLTERLPMRPSEFGVLKSVLEHQPDLDTALTIYENCVGQCEVLLVGWHTPPVYDATEIIRVQAELNEPIFQNHYKRGSFDREDLQVDSRRVDEFELWTVTRR